jgi:hypothetical protein
MSNKALEANSIPIPPHLVGLLKQTLGRSGTGFDEGAFLQQLHYWTLNSETTGWRIDGVKWIYNSLKSWQQQFPWMSEYGLRKAISNLKKLELIQTAQHWINSYRRVMFYRIDYEKLKAFAADLCDLVAPQCVKDDPIEMRSDRTTDTETSSKISSEQQPVVVSEMKQKPENINALEKGDRAFDEKVPSSKADYTASAGSGKYLEVQNSQFPELIDAVDRALFSTSSNESAQASGSRLPTVLARAIAEFPERVEPAIAYLKDPQKRHRIQNPAGYLYRAIMEGWRLSVTPRSSSSVIPDGFSSWFDWAKAGGLVVAATVIEGVHQTLQAEGGWLPTDLMMQQYPGMRLG